MSQPLDTLYDAAKPAVWDQARLAPSAQALLDGKPAIVGAKLAMAERAAALPAGSALLNHSVIPSRQEYAEMTEAQLKARVGSAWNPHQDVRAIAELNRRDYARLPQWRKDLLALCEHVDGDTAASEALIALLDTIRQPLLADPKSVAGILADMHDLMVGNR